MFLFRHFESFESLALVCWQISCSTQWLRELHVAGLIITHICAADELTSVSCGVRKKISTLLGGPFHSGAPRLCLPCLPYRDATGYSHGSFQVSLHPLPLQEQNRQHMLVAHYNNRDVSSFLTFDMFCNGRKMYVQLSHLQFCFWKCFDEMSY